MNTPNGNVSVSQRGVKLTFKFLFWEADKGKWENINETTEK